MLQRCHVCGRVDESCKPCEHCGWWFCEKHIDTEQHVCMGLKTLRQIDVKPEQTSMLEPLKTEASAMKRPLSIAEREMGESLLDENLSKGLEKLSKMILLYIVGSPVIGVLIFMGVIMSTIGSVVLTGFGMPTDLLGMALSL